MKTNTLDFDAQALRERILDLAMRGKLVPQDPNDEPASVLLEKIKTEKAELIKEKKIKQTKALPAITDDEKPFDIPDSWEWVRLGDIFDITSSKRVMKSEWKEEGIPFYRAREIVSIKNHQKLKDPIFISKDTYEEKLKVSGRPQVDDILLTGVGTLGIPYVVSTNKDFYFKDGNIIWLRNIKKINPDFISYYVQSPYMLKIINNGRGTTVATLTIVRAKSLLVPLPPLSEQSRIAAKIAQLFALLRKVETSTQQYAELQTLLKSKVLDLAMRGKLVKQDPNDEPASVLLEKIKAEKAELVKEKKIKKSKPLPPITDEEKPFELPSGWAWVRLNDILALENGSIRRGPFGSSLKKAFFVPKSDNTYKVYEQGNAINHTINYGSYYISSQKYKELSSFAVRPGDIIISGAGTIGKTYILPDKTPKGIINQALIRIRVDDKLVLKDYFLLAFSQKVNLLNKQAKGTAIKNMFSVAHMKKDLIWALPSILEQKRIVDEITEIFDLIKK